MKHIVIFVKYPQAGKVKTRLGAQIGHEHAAALYRIFIDKTFELVKQTSAYAASVAFTPEYLADKFHALIPPEFKAFPQIDGDLGVRMLKAMQAVQLSGAKKIVVLGSDSPTLPASFIDRAFDRLDLNDLVLGPAEDGGYYLVGVKKPHEVLFQNIEWSSPAVLQTTLQLAAENRLSCHLLPNWYDVDDIDTLKRAAADDERGDIQTYLNTYLDNTCKNP
ncbi:MAG: TIGR04282 family arsenosugar biosynthesis glycosyltransferase [bacterium]